MLVLLVNELMTPKRSQKVSKKVIIKLANILALPRKCVSKHHDNDLPLPSGEASIIRCKARSLCTFKSNKVQLSHKSA